MEKSTSELDMDRFMLIAEGHAAFQLLWAGVQFDLFSKLSEQKTLTADELQLALSIGKQPIRILLTGLTARGLIRKVEAGYQNASLSEIYLVKNSPRSIIPILGWQHHIVYKGLFDFTESLKTDTNVGLRNFPGDGITLYERLVSHPETEQIFQNAMSALSKQANEDFLAVVDFQGIKHLVDVGGGNGTNAIAIANRNQNLKLTVFDSESVCNIARENIKSNGLSDRVDTYNGDLFTTPFPKGVDAFLFSHMFTIWAPEKNKEILDKTYNALPKGGKVFIFNMMGNDDESGPMSTALGSPYFHAIATGEGMLYTWADYERWLTESGFSSFRRYEGLPMDHGLFVAIK